MFGSNGNDGYRSMNRTAQGDATTDATLSLPLLLHGALLHSTCTQTWKQEMFALKRRIHHCNCAHSKTLKKLKDQCHRRAHLSMSASSALVKSASCHRISKNCKFMQLLQAAFMPPYRLGCCCMGHSPNVGTRERCTNGFSKLQDTGSLTQTSWYN
jgi:hypothetical protein